MAALSGPPLRAGMPDLRVADENRRRRLRRMKAVATGLLLAAAAVYALTIGQEGALGYVNAAAEAAMVGALADWFAVTALFRRPLGLPIPHTALIQTRKDALGESLQEFVATNFLSEPLVREKIAGAEVSRRVGRWLVDGGHAERVATEAAAVTRGLLSVVDDDDVVSVLENVLLRRGSTSLWSPVAGRLLDGILDDGDHQRVFDLLLDEALGWLEVNEETVVLLVTDQAPSWTPQWVDNRIGRRVYGELVRWVQEIRLQNGHPARRAIDDLLRRVARDLREDVVLQDRVEALKDRLLEHPELRTATVSAWSAVRQLLLEAVEDPGGELRKRIVRAIEELGDRLAADPRLQARLDGYLVDAAGYVVRGYAHEIATIISDTVRRWDATDASRRIELHVGRDLQFIRINGTVVGALAGLAIHTVTGLIA